MTHISNPTPTRRGTRAGLALIFAVIVSMAALAFALVAVHDARVARAPADARLLQAPKVPGERPQARPTEFWA